MPQVAMINRAAQTLLNLKESWQEATQQEQRELVQPSFLQKEMRGALWIYLQ